ncbi:Bacteriophage replication protein O [compost metagenome]
MANPQLEDGYTRVANEILEAVARAPFNGTQYGIILIIWRYTYGFKRKSHQLATRFIAEAIQSDLSGVKAELNKLIERKVIQVIREGNGPRPRTIALNKNHEEWLVVESSPPVSKKSSGRELSTIVVEDSPPLVVEDSLPKKEKRKTIKKGDIDMSSPIPKIQFAEYVFLTQTEYDRLCNDFGKKKVDDTIEALDEWQTNKKPNQRKKDHNKTLRVWIKRDLEKAKTSFKPRAQRNQEEYDILNQFYEEGAAREANGDSKLPSDDQDRLSLL